jgi:hypothetical protein
LTAWHRAAAVGANAAAAVALPGGAAAVAAAFGTDVAFVFGRGDVGDVEERAAAGGDDFEDEAPQPAVTPTAKTRTSDTSILPIKSTSRSDPLTGEGYGVRKPVRQRCL